MCLNPIGTIAPDFSSGAIVDSGANFNIKLKPCFSTKSYRLIICKAGFCTLWLFQSRYPLQAPMKDRGLSTAIGFI